MSRSFIRRAFQLSGTCCAANLEQVVVRVRELPIPANLAEGNYASDAGYRREPGLGAGVWEEKDRYIAKCALIEVNLVCPESPRNQ